MKQNTTRRFSRNTSVGAIFAERFNRTIRSLLKKPIFEKVNAGWLGELPSVIQQYKITIHHSIKIAPILNKNE